jgi:hypothetical protein
MVGEHHEDEEHAEANGGNGEESVGNISTLRRLPGGLQHPDVICQTRTWNAAGTDATAAASQRLPNAFIFYHVPRTAPPDLP